MCMKESTCDAQVWMSVGLYAPCWDANSPTQRKNVHADLADLSIGESLMETPHVYVCTYIHMYQEPASIMYNYCKQRRSLALFAKPQDVKQDESSLCNRELQHNVVFSASLGSFSLGCIGDPPE